MGIAYQLVCHLSGRSIAALEQLKPAYFENLVLFGLPCILPIRGSLAHVLLPRKTHLELSVFARVEILTVFRVSVSHAPIYSAAAFWQESCPGH